MNATAVLGLQALDLATTLWLLKHGGSELNPLLNVLQRLLGRDGGIVAAKIAVAVALFLIPLQLWQLAVLAAFYVGIVSWNVYQISRA